MPRTSIFESLTANTPLDEDMASRFDPSPAFKAWFGDSKVVDAQGNPLRVFHGTSANIEKFGHSGNGAGARESRLGYWFTDNTDAANDFAAFARGGDERYRNVVPVYLSIKNPWYPQSYLEIMDFMDAHTDFERPGGKVMGRQIRMQGDKPNHASAVADLRSKGYDGIILLNTLTDSPNRDAGVTTNQYVIFSPSQAKSVFNRGDYNPDSDHISEERVDELQLPWGKSKEKPVVWLEKNPTHAKVRVGDDVYILDRVTDVKNPRTQQFSYLWMAKNAKGRPLGIEHSDPAQIILALKKL